MQVRTNVWIEREGKVALSRWRVALLQAVQDTGSISAAAQRIGIPYHRAWDKIHECEQRLGVSLISTQTGGAGGGGARLTPEGIEYVRRFQQFSQGLDEIIGQRFIEAFSGSPLFSQGGGNPLFFPQGHRRAQGGGMELALGDQNKDQGG